MEVIRVRKFNKERNLYEIVFEADNKNNEYELGTGKFDLTGKPTFVGDIIEGDVNTEFGAIKAKGIIQYDNLHQQFVCRFENISGVFGNNLPVSGIKVVGSLKENPKLLEEFKSEKKV